MVRFAQVPIDDDIHCGSLRLALCIKKKHFSFACVINRDLFMCYVPVILQVKERNEF